MIKIKINKSSLQKLSDTGMLNYAAMDFDTAEEYLRGNIRCGNVFLYSHYAGWILEYSNLSVLRIRWHLRSRGGPCWKMELVTNQGEKYVITDLGAREFNMRFNDEVSPLIQKSRDNSPCKLKVIDKYVKEAGPGTFYFS